MTDVQMYVCGAFLQRRRGGGGWGGYVAVMLIKAAHLQPIKAPLSFIKANLLKHAARDVKTSRPCCTLTLILCLPLSPPLSLALSPDQWMVPGPVIPSGMSEDAFRCIWPRNRERASSCSVCAELQDRSVSLW